MSHPAITIGIVGHVDHGKTTLVNALSGKWTDTHSEEIKRGITIRLGYADFSVYKCKCKDLAYSLQETCQKCKAKGEFVRKISIVDAPGHESLMATMLCGANIMDCALLLVAANEPCPQPQTVEHLTALEIIGLDKLIVVQNKIDLVNEEQAIKNHNEIKAFLKGTKYEHAPIVPISARHNVNIDALLSTIEEIVPTPKRDTEKNPVFFVARSFDVNKPGTGPAGLVGGILGGTLKQGKITEGMDIVILPGYEVEERNQKVWKPLNTKVMSMIVGGDKVNELTPGGSSALQTTLDPSIVKSDKLVGSVAGIPGKLSKVISSFKMEPHLLERVVGAKDKLVVEPIKLGEFLMLNVNTAATVGVVKELGKGLIKVELRRPICVEDNSRITISRSVGQRWRLIGYGTIKA